MGAAGHVHAFDSRSNGKTYTQPLTLRLDPRVKTPAAGLAQLASLTQEMYDGAVAVARRRRAGARASRRSSTSISGAEAAALKARIDSHRTAGRAGGRGGRGGRGRRSWWTRRRCAAATVTLEAASGAMLAAAMAMQAAEVAPTAAKIAACARARAEAAPVLAKWSALKTTIAAFNTKQKAAGQPTVTLAERRDELSLAGESVEGVSVASAPPRALDSARAGTFVASVLTSAFLLFLLQPMLGRMLLPVFGGSPAVWNTCMVFFQILLLAGYAYAHGSSAATRVAPAGDAPWVGPRSVAVLSSASVDHHGSGGRLAYRHNFGWARGRGRRAVLRVVHEQLAHAALVFGGLLSEQRRSVLALCRVERRIARRADRVPLRRRTGVRTSR